MKQNYLSSGWLPVYQVCLPTPSYELQLRSTRSGLDLVLGHPVREARTSFFLACCEQLMPALNDQLIEHTVLPTAQ